MKEFRLLTANEIEVRAAQISDKGIVLLLYKDARCDMNILDETVGPMNWMRSHSRDNANCTVSLWDEEKKQWISKEDTGTESNTEAEKGLASDSFKRACFNWGIGRELYTAPFMFFPAELTSGIIDKKKCYDRFEVIGITYLDKRTIKNVIILNTRTGKQKSFGDEAKISDVAPKAKPAQKKEEPKNEEAAPKTALISRVEEKCRRYDDGFAAFVLRTHGNAKSFDKVCDKYIKGLSEDTYFNKVVKAYEAYKVADAKEGA